MVVNVQLWPGLWKIKIALKALMGYWRKSEFDLGLVTSIVWVGVPAALSLW